MSKKNYVKLITLKLMKIFHNFTLIHSKNLLLQPQYYPPISVVFQVAVFKWTQ